MSNDPGVSAAPRVPRGHGFTQYGPLRLGRLIVEFKVARYRISGFRKVTGHHPRIGRYRGRVVVVPLRQGEARLLIGVTVDA